MPQKTTISNLQKIYSNQIRACGFAWLTCLGLFWITYLASPQVSHFVLAAQCALFSTMGFAVVFGLFNIHRLYALEQSPSWLKH